MNYDKNSTCLFRLFTYACLPVLPLKLYFTFTSTFTKNSESDIPSFALSSLALGVCLPFGDGLFRALIVLSLKFRI